MANAPKQQVIIITFNQGDFLRECLLSILESSIQPSRVSIFDDCSTDHTIAVVSEFAEKFRGCLEFHQNEANLGIYRNLALAKHSACEDIIHLIGGDDFFDPKFFEEIQLSYFANDIHLDNRKYMIMSSYFEVDKFSRFRRTVGRSLIFKKIERPKFSMFLKEKILHRNLGLSLNYFKEMPVHNSDKYIWFDLYLYLAHILALEVIYPAPDAKSAYRVGSGVTSRVPKSQIWMSRVYAISKFYIDFFQNSRVTPSLLIIDVMKSALMTLAWLMIENIKARQSSRNV